MKALKSISYTVLGLFFAILIHGCIEPIDIDTQETEELLVVDGLVTTFSDSALNRVKLSKTERFKGAKEFILNKPVDGAEVIIADNLGNRAYLEHIGRGEYRLLSSSLKAVVGREYTLHVLLPNGKQYISAPEKILPVAPIADLSYVYKVATKVVVNGSGDRVEMKSAAFEINLSAEDPAEIGNYYRWESRGTFEYFTRPPEGSPWPSQCWYHTGRIDSKVTVQDDGLFNGKHFKKAVVSVPFDRPTKYKVEVRQFSVTRQAYNYWRLFEDQQTSVGSMFDPPPAKIRGNMRNVDDPQEEVIGFFGASDVKERYIVINRTLHAPKPGPAAYIPEGGSESNCLVFIPGGTTVRPVGM